MKKPTHTQLKDFFTVVLGDLLLAFAITYFADRGSIVPGGVSGVSILLKNLCETQFGFTLPLSVTTWVLNLPLFLVCWKQRGWRFVARSVFSVTLLSLMLGGFELLPFVLLDIQGDTTLAGVFYGLVGGAGIGLVLSTTATTGGTDMLALIIKHKHPSFPVSRLIMVINGTIVAVGGFLSFGPVPTLYSVLAAVISSLVINQILDGMNFAKAAFILTDKFEEMSETIMNTLHRGNTGIQARGMYTHQDKVMLFVVVSRKQAAYLRRIVHSVDPHAFLVITDAKEVLGKGFLQDYDAISLN